MIHRPRAMAPGELSAVARVWQEAWHETQRPHVPPELLALRTSAEFRRRLIDYGDALRVIGPVDTPYGMCVALRDEVKQIFLAPQARGTGAAGALLADAEARLAAAGARRAHLDCLIENSRARQFYASHGWQERGVEVVNLDTSAGPFPMRCVVLEKILGDPA